MDSSAAVRAAGLLLCAADAGRACGGVCGHRGHWKHHHVRAVRQLRRRLWPTPPGLCRCSCLCPSCCQHASIPSARATPRFGGSGFPLRGKVPGALGAPGAHHLSTQRGHISCSAVRPAAHRRAPPLIRRRPRRLRRWPAAARSAPAGGRPAGAPLPASAPTPAPTVRSWRTHTRYVQEDPAGPAFVAAKAAATDAGRLSPAFDGTWVAGVLSACLLATGA